MSVAPLVIALFLAAPPSSRPVRPPASRPAAASVPSPADELDPVQQALFYRLMAALENHRSKEITTLNDQIRRAAAAKYSNREQRRARDETIRRLRKQISELERRDEALLPDLSQAEMGQLPPALQQPKIVQVLDGETMLVRSDAGTRIYRIEGVSTEGLADDMRVDLTGKIFRDSGTTKYTTVMGSTNTVTTYARIDQAVRLAVRQAYLTGWVSQEFKFRNNPTH